MSTSPRTAMVVFYFQAVHPLPSAALATSVCAVIVWWMCRRTGRRINVSFLLVNSVPRTLVVLYSTKGAVQE